MIYYKFRDFTMVPPITYIKNMMLVDKYRHVEGAIVECGTWRGGSIAGMSTVLADQNRKYYIYDSFEGLPDATAEDGQAAVDYQNDTTHPHYFDNCTAEMAYVQNAMKIAQVNPDNITITQGWFIDTLPHFDKNEKIAILRMDGDFYDSTMQCFDYLYDQVVPGGLIIIDDYFPWDGCVRAIYDFMSKRGLADRIRFFDNDVVYIEKLGEEFHKEA